MKKGMLFAFIIGCNLSASETPSRQIIYTLHAQERMFLRNISMQEVESAIAAGKRIAKKDIYVYREDKLKVFVSQDTGAVVSVMKQVKSKQARLNSRIKNRQKKLCNLDAIAHTCSDKAESKEGQAEIIMQEQRGEDFFKKE